MISFKDPCELTKINESPIPLAHLKMQAGTNFYTSVKTNAAKSLIGNGSAGVIFGAFHDSVSRSYGASINLPDVDTGTQICGPRDYIMGGDWITAWGTPSTTTNSVHTLTQ